MNSNYTIIAELVLEHAPFHDSLRYLGQACKSCNKIFEQRVSADVDKFIANTLPKEKMPDLYRLESAICASLYKREFHYAYDLLVRILDHRHKSPRQVEHIVCCLSSKTRNAKFNSRLEQEQLFSSSLRLLKNRC